MYGSSPTLAYVALFLKFRDHTLLDTRTPESGGITRLNQQSARHRDRYIHSTQQTQDTNIRGFSRIRTYDPRNRSAAEYV
jgi:hypothetical protein